LAYAGIPMGKCYDIIKALSKKQVKVIRETKDVFISGFSHKLREEDFTIDDDRINNIVEQAWTIIIDSARYGFNASHSLAYAIDSLYGAWLKANYPYEFYEVVLQMYSDKGKKDKVHQLIKEMKEGFDIKSGEFMFGVDNRAFNMNKETGEIYPSILSIKNMNDMVAQELYKIKDVQFNYFTNLLVYLLEETILTKTHIDILIKINYFKKFGKNKKLDILYDEFQKKYKKTHVGKTKEKRLCEMIDFELTLEDKSYTMKEQYGHEIKKLGYPITVLPSAPSNLYVLSEFDDKYGIKIKCYNIKTGDVVKFTMYKDDWKLKPIGLCSVIQFDSYIVKKDGSLRLKEYKYI
jgi:DNA polymerase III alpha subunit